MYVFIQVQREGKGDILKMMGRLCTKLGTASP